MRRPTALLLATLTALAPACAGGAGEGGTRTATRSAAPATDGGTSAGQARLERQVTVTFAGVPPLTVEVAHTPEQRRKGLMGRTEVPVGTGMLFLFPKATRTGFWMKNTLVPLSIAYVDRDRVVSVAEMTPCRRDPCPSYPPDGSYTFAVEARANFFTEHRVRPGTAVSLDGELPRAS